MLFLLTGIGLVSTLGTARSAQASPVVAQVGGGGTAIFDDPSNTLFGLITTFGMGVIFRSDGSATGQFECVVPGVLTLSVVPTSGSAGPGVATFSGPAIYHFAGGGTTVPSMPFTVTVTPGGAGVGTFCVNPSAGGTPPCDHETVVNGNVSIHTP
jgi:hypothetical protein